MLKPNCNRFSSSRDVDHDFQKVDAQLAPWTQSFFGKYIIASEQISVDEHVVETGGHRGMVLKVMDSTFNIEGSSQLHKFTLAPFRGADVATLAEVDALPLPSDVVDVVVLHHVLDFCEYPHEALNESARIVQASGHLVIIGFNPWSLFGLWRLIGRCVSSAPIWRCRCMSVSRITDWLRFVGFQPEKTTYGAFRPPLKRSGLLKRMGFVDRLMKHLQLPLGGYYVISARKIRLRPIRGKKQWLATAIKPVKLASRTRIEKRKKPEKC